MRPIPQSGSRRVMEFNGCHSPENGRFCSTEGGGIGGVLQNHFAQWKQRTGNASVKDFLFSRKSDWQKALPENPSRYFKMDDETVMVPVDKLDFPFQPDDGEVSRAAKFMRLAYKGDHDKRKPISLRKTGNRYLILDGKATTTIAKRSGWKKIPAKLFP